LNVEQDLSARTQYPDNDVFVCHLITLSQDLIAYGDGARNFSSRDWKKPTMIKKLIGKNIKHVAIPTTNELAMLTFFHNPILIRIHQTRADINNNLFGELLYQQIFGYFFALYEFFTPV
ncbi:hypothetical protein ACJX0J_026953, partial [Zea mays]